ncbi:MAG: hypothetical protein QW589_07355 [Candidatus Bathyarchaeia archaeon]
MTVAKDKTNYATNETVNVFGEFTLERIKTNAYANLSLEFDSEPIF